MSRRLELTARLTALRDVNGILEAMKSLALVEVGRIATFIEAQRACLGVIETVVDDFIADRPLAETGHEADVLCAFGAERSFCGDFNARIATTVRQLLDDATRPTRTVLVGAGLTSHWTGPATAIVAGPSIADEVPAVLQRLADTVATMLEEASEPGLTGLLLVSHSADAIVVRRLLPLQRRPAARHPYPLRLNLPPRQFSSLLVEQYIYALLHAALYDSLLAENRRRVDHMESALRRLDERLGELVRLQNRLRQEEITEEIEILMLSLEAESGSGGESGNGSHAAPTHAAMW